jgi:hypothetical protein
MLPGSRVKEPNNTANDETRYRRPNFGNVVAETEEQRNERLRKEEQETETKLAQAEAVLEEADRAAKETKKRPMTREEYIAFITQTFPDSPTRLPFAQKNIARFSKARWGEENDHVTEESFSERLAKVQDW